MSALEDLLRATPATFATQTAESSKSSESSRGASVQTRTEASRERSQPPRVVVDFDPERTRRAAERIEAERERRQQRVLAMLAEAAESVRYAYLAELDSHPEFAIVALAIRGVGVVELSIPKTRYDCFELLKVIAHGQRVVTSGEIPQRALAEASSSHIAK